MSSLSTRSMIRTIVSQLRSARMLQKVPQPAVQRIVTLILITAPLQSHIIKSNESGFLIFLIKNEFITQQGYVTDTVKCYARRVLKYVYNTQNFVLRYSSLDTKTLRSFCNASFALDISYSVNQPQEIERNAYSVSGHLVFNYGNLINWGTAQQSIIATSSTAATSPGTS